MSLTVPAQEPVLRAVEQLLTHPESGLLTGRGAAPAGSGWSTDRTTFRAYLVLYSRGMPAAGGPVSDRYADVDHAFQLTAVGTDEHQAGAVADLARARLLAGQLLVPGRHVQELLWDGQPQPPSRDDDTRPPLWYAVDLYTVRTTPITPAP